MFSIEIINAINEKGTDQGGVAESKARYWINKGIEAGLQEAVELIHAQIDIVVATKRLRKGDEIRDLAQIQGILQNWQRLAREGKPGLGLANRAIQS
jgi:hypothetical protein